MKVIALPQYDNGIKVLFTIRVDKIRADLNGAEVILKMQHRETGRKIIRNCSITDATMGECQYILTSEDLSEIGEISSELETRFSDGKILSEYDPILIRVKEEMITDESRRRVSTNVNPYSSGEGSRVLNRFFGK
ncbi:MAG: BppU family phage baseplate upper protein [Cellulosilyticaceae bacterium]